MSLVEALQLGLFVALATACLALWADILRSAVAGREIVPYQPRLGVPWGPRDVALIVIITVALQAACAWTLLRNAPDTGIDAPAAPHAADETTADADGADSEALQAKIRRTFSLIAAASLGNLLALAAAYALLRSHGADHADLGLDLSHAVQDSKLGVAGFAAASVPVFVIQATLSQFVEPQHPVTDIFAAHPGATTILLTALFAVVVAPLAEEFFFRVILQGWLEALYAARAAQHLAETSHVSNASASADGDTASDEFERQGAVPPEPRLVDGVSRPARESVERSAAVSAIVEVSARMQRRTSLMPVLISSLVFAAVHWDYGPSSVPLFFFAMVLGYLYRQTHRLLPSVVAHACLNGLSTLVMVTAGP